MDCIIHRVRSKRNSEKGIGGADHIWANWRFKFTGRAPNSKSRMEKTGKTSEFSAAYKLKSGSEQQKKDARLRRRSVEWKNLRGEQVNKRRNLKNLSPLQETKENHPQRSMYKDKTPTKSSKGVYVEKECRIEVN